MKRNNILYLAIVTFGLSTLTGCRNENDNLSSGEEVTLSFRSTVKDMNQEAVTRGTIANDFFEEGNGISIEVTTNRKGADGSNIITSHNYSYGSDGVFTGDFRFKLDDTYIEKLVARWPSDDVRDESGIVLDQRDPKDFQQADRLEAIAQGINIMPTAEPIPLTFKHEQSKFSFRMAGQNAYGLNILSVILELQYPDPDKGNALQSGAFWAYCPGNETAGLILTPGTAISTSNPNFQIVDGRYMIGQAKVGNPDEPATQYTGGIWLKEDVAITLQANTDYLVTLTPEGYNLIATIEIGGFGQNEGYVGIPIHMPTPKADEADTYEIGNAIQLVTLSRLLKGGYIANQDAATWKEYNYVIKDNITITDAWQYFLPIEATLKDNFKNEAGEPVTTITYNSTAYPLFAN